MAAAPRPGAAAPLAGAQCGRLPTTHGDRVAPASAYLHGQRGAAQPRGPEPGASTRREGGAPGAAPQAPDGQARMLPGGSARAQSTCLEPGASTRREGGTPRAYPQAPDGQARLLPAGSARDQRPLPHGPLPAPPPRAGARLCGGGWGAPCSQRRPITCPPPRKRKRGLHPGAAACLRGHCGVFRTHHPARLGPKGAGRTRTAAPHTRPPAGLLRSGPRRLRPRLGCRGPPPACTRRPHRARACLWPRLRNWQRQLPCFPQK